MIAIAEKRCMECGTPYKGRPDKKFCTDQCRTSYNNRLNSDEVNYIRNINNILRRNRRILRTLNPRGTSKVSKEILSASGFDFNYVTSVCTTRDGKQYCYCYEQGYVRLGKTWYLLVSKDDFLSP